MTFYLNNNQPEFNNKIVINNNTKNLIDNENKKKLNFKGNHIIEIAQNNKNQIPMNYFNNDNYDFDINYSNNNNYYRSEASLENKQPQQQFINNNIFKKTTNNTNEILISSSSDNDNDKIDFEDDYENDMNDMNFSKLKTELLASTIATTATTNTMPLVTKTQDFNDYLNVFFSSSSSLIAKLDLHKCRYISKFSNYYKKHELNNFEDLQKVFILLRKSLNKIKIKQDFNELEKKRDLDYNNQQLPKTNNNFLAFDNLTYSSSVEDLTSCLTDKSKNYGDLEKPKQPHQQLLANDALFKKTLKSIKRKDKLKKETKSGNNNTSELKVENTSISTSEIKRQERESRSRQPKQHQIVQPADSVDINEELIASNKEFEKQLRRKYRCKSVARSIRRAKSVFYRNRRSKSLESLSALALVDLKLKYPEQNEDLLNKLATSCANSIMSSCSSFTSATSCASDISSSYFHELSQWSPNFSDSESVDSNSLSLEDVDWEANLPDLPLVRLFSF